MGKSSKIVQASVQLRPAPQVLSMANASLDRIEKLLTLFETRLTVLAPNADKPDALPNRDIQALGRMILTLQKEWTRYASLLYPAEEIASPLEMAPKAPETGEKTESDFPDSVETYDLQTTAAHLKESMAALFEDLESMQACGSLPLIESGMQTQYEKKRAKKEAKKQKFSHAFFRKQPVAAAL